MKSSKNHTSKKHRNERTRTTRVLGCWSSTSSLASDWIGIESFNHLCFDLYIYIYTIHDSWLMMLFDDCRGLYYIYTYIYIHIYIYIYISIQHLYVAVRTSWKWPENCLAGGQNRISRSPFGIHHVFSSTWGCSWCFNLLQPWVINHN